MLWTQTLPALTAFAFVSSITPGPNNLMLMTSGTNFGFRRTVPHLLGVALGFVLMIVLVGLGLAELFARYPLAHAVLKWVSVIYLLYLAWKIATARPVGDRQTAEGRPLTFLQAALFQWVNPKAWTMALTGVTVYMPPVDPWIGLALVAGLFGAVNLPSVALWAAMGVKLRGWLGDARRLRMFNMAAALLLVGSLYPSVTG
ncbi:LysE family translocator [Sphingomonas sp.]|uniref:LysE family translocator n=1 Tax=Sphingomonas sp. TaxID=28214 RepID=UPI002EDAF7BA